MILERQRKGKPKREGRQNREVGERNERGEEGSAPIHLELK